MKNRRVVLVSRPPTGGPQAENIRVEDITPHGRLDQQRLHASETGLQKMGSASSSMSQTGLSEGNLPIPYNVWPSERSWPSPASAEKPERTRS
jgi:hypothetical protein